MGLQIDQVRYNHFGPDDRRVTGIFVRARHPEQTTHDMAGRWDTIDIYFLTRDSLLEWLRSRGGDNEWAENVVGTLLGHGHLHEGEEVAGE